MVGGWFVAPVVEYDGLEDEGSGCYGSERCGRVWEGLYRTSGYREG